MKRSQQTTKIPNVENASRPSKCPSLANQGYSRKSDRIPLGAMQDLANKKQYSTVDFNEKEKSSRRSTSVFSSQDISLFNSSSGQRGITAESTRIAPTSPIKQTLKALSATITSRQLRKPSLQRDPVPTGCSGVQDTATSSSSSSNVKFYKDNIIDLGDDSDDEFEKSSRRSTSVSLWQDISSFTSSSGQRGITAESTRIAPTAIKQTLMALPSTKTTRQLRKPSLQRDPVPTGCSGVQDTATSSSSSSNVKFDKDNIIDLCDDSDDVFLPPTAAKHTDTDSNRHSLKTTHSGLPVPSPSCTQSSALESFQSTAALKERKDCRRASSTCSTPTDQSANKNTTLPTQNFVILSQESLEPTVAPDTSESDTLVPIPLSKVKVVRDSSIFSEEERSFVDGQAFFQEKLLMYSPEYLEDIILHSYKHRLNLLLEQDWVERYMDRRHRTTTLNWLHQVTILMYPHLNVIYSLVRIFDYAVVKLRLTKDRYQVAAMVALWLSLKYLDSTVQLKVSDIYYIMGGQYQREEISSMEKAILKTIDFSLNISDPLDFLYYYLKSSNLENNELLMYGSEFVLECSTLFENYPFAESPFIAASALYLANKVLNKKEVNVNFFSYDQEKIKKYAERVLAINVKSVIINRLETLSKYLTTEKLKVAMKFF